MDIHAWKKALILRGCPPAEILYGPVEESLRAHLDVCPMCREHLALSPEEREGWAAMGRILLPESLSPPEGKAPGQIWRVRAALSGWGRKNRFCTPPNVLVLDVQGDTALVAQVYPGDDFLSEEDVALSGHGFAEPWNVYGLALEDLETYRGEAGEAVAAVVEMSQGTFADVDEAAPLFRFRTLELELGAFFAGQSLSRLLEAEAQPDQPQKPLLLGAMTPQDLERALRGRAREIRLRDDQPPLLQLARYAREDAEYGLAASAHHTQLVNYAVLDPIGVEIRQASITFSTVHYTDGILVLGGRINADFASTAEFFAWWDARERLVHAENAVISTGGPYFNLRFNGVSEREFHVGRLVALLSGILHEE